MAMSDRRGVVIDKDGTLLVDVPYNVDPALMQLTPGAGDALRTLQAAGYALMVASNQSGVARGYFQLEAMAVVRQRLDALVRAEGAELSAFCYCPHHPAGCRAEFAIACHCRKPEPGLLLEAASIAGCAPAACWMVGDILDDVEAGRRAGMRTILIANGNETEWQRLDERVPDHIAGGLAEAARFIVCADAAALETASGARA